MGIDPKRSVLTLYSKDSSSLYNQCIHPTVLIKPIKVKRGKKEKEEVQII